jgi:hypothetical protein
VRQFAGGGGLLLGEADLNSNHAKPAPLSY